MFGLIGNWIGSPGVQNNSYNDLTNLYSPRIAVNQSIYAQLSVLGTGLGGLAQQAQSAPILQTPLDYLILNERDQLTPEALFALQSGSTEETYLNEVRLLIGKRFL